MVTSMQKGIDMNNIDIEDMGADDLMNILLTQGQDAFEDAFSQWYTDENQTVYDLVIQLVDLVKTNACM
jgi:hypothetical protein